MANKNSVADWDVTPINNDNVGGVDISEGCAPSGINNALRALMGQVKAFHTGVLEMETELAEKASPADIQTAIDALLGAAPAQLDTLVELAAALGNDGNYAATTTAALAARLRKDQNLADLPNVATARANLGVSYPLQHKGDLGNSSHLDDVIASGLYSKHSGEAATLEKGFPFGSAGTLRVFNTDLAGGRAGFIIQEYDTMDFGRWRRTHANPAGWRPWVKQYTGAITISTAAPSGGVDGDIWHQV